MSETTQPRRNAKGRRCLSEDQVREIRRLLCQGMSQRQIAALFNVTQPVVSYIATGKTYNRKLHVVSLRGEPKPS
jgi:predicted transcriptional regulator